jgi:hypothetical protein
VWRWQNDLGGRRELIGTGILGGLLFSARPDLMAFSALMPIFLLLAGPTGQKRRQAFLLGAVSLAVLLAQLGAAWLYFGNPLPLPFYVKQGGIYDDAHYQKLYRFLGLAYFAFFGFHYAPLLTFIVIEGTARLMYRLRPRPQIFSFALLLSSLGAWAYYFFILVHEMGCQARFYQSLVPALVYLAGQSLAHIYQKVGRPASESDISPRRRVWLVLLAILGLGILFRLASPRPVEFINLSAGRCNIYIASDFNVRGQIPRSLEIVAHIPFWRGLADVATLPSQPPLVIAATEIGLPAALNLEARLVDLTGLHDAEVTFGGVSQTDLFAQNPDLIYMPHPHRWRLLSEMRQTLAKRQDYLYYPEMYQTPRGLIIDPVGQEAPDWTYLYLGVAIRRDSPHFEALKAIMDAATAEIIAAKAQ